MQGATNFLLCMLQIASLAAFSCISLQDLSDELCTCAEITCDGKRILKMNFRNQNLSGRIPDEIGKLVHLQVLDLRNNSLSGELPESLSSLSQLRVLDVGSNSLSGGLNVMDMPLWWNFPRIETIMLDHNHFMGTLPDNASIKLSNLRRFSVGNNRLTGTVPKYLYENPADLQWLVLSSNKFTGDHPLTEITKNLRQLTLLSIGSPDMEAPDRSYEQSTIPNSINSLLSLEVLDLSNSHLYGTIPELTAPGTRSLRHVLLHRNQLTGAIPPTLMTNNPELETLTLYNNELEGHIPAITQNMSRIYLQGNRLAGNVPHFNTDHPIKACVIPGNGFSREINLGTNYGLPTWIPKSMSQVAFFAFGDAWTFSDPDSLVVLMMYLVVSIGIFTATAGVIVLPKVSQFLNPLPSARSNIRATATVEADAFFKFARQLFAVCSILSVICLCNAVIFSYGAKYYGDSGYEFNKLTMTYLESTPQEPETLSHLTEVIGSVFLTFFDIAVMGALLFLHVKGKGGSVAQWWGENSVWEIGLASRRGTTLRETGSQSDSIYRDGASGDTYDWVQKRSRNFTAELHEDMNHEEEFYARRHSGSDYGTFIESDRSSGHFPPNASTINSGSGSRPVSASSTGAMRGKLTLSAMFWIAFPTLLWWLFMLCLAALVAFLKMLYYVPSNNVYNWYNPREILLLWDALLTLVIVSSNSVFIPGATQILRPMMCCCEDRDYIDTIPGSAPRHRRRSAPFIIVMFSRLVITVFVPVFTILIMDQHCFAVYRSAFQPCAPSEQSDWNVSLTYPTSAMGVQLTVMTSDQFCGREIDNFGDCSRSMLGFLGPFYFKLLCCVAFVQPAIVLCLGRCSKRASKLDAKEQEEDDDDDCFPSGHRKAEEKSNRPGCKELRLGLENQAPLLLSLFELMMLFGAFVPPLMILGLVAIITNAIAVRFNLLTMAWQPEENLTRDVDGNLSDSLGRKPPALGWYTAVSFLLLYILQFVFYWENNLDGCAILGAAPPVLAIITGSVYGLRRWREYRNLRSDNDGESIGDMKTDPFLTTGF